MLNKQKVIPLPLQFQAIREDLLGLVQEHPYLIHSWRFALGAIYALDNTYYYSHIERNTYTDGRQHIKVTLQVIEQFNNRKSPDLTWIAGFYFNAALMRIAAFYERSIRSLFKETLQDEKLNVMRKGTLKGKKISCLHLPELIPIIESRLFNRTTLKRVKADRVREEVNKLKHKLNGVLPEDAVNMKDAITALAEIIAILKKREANQELKNLYRKMAPPA